MDIYQDLNPRIKSRKKFYDKIRVHLNDINLPPPINDQDANKADPSENPSHLEYGVVTKDEFLAILESYELQQSTRDQHNKPVKCEQVTGGSFAKLLFSRPGFHNLGSTGHLIDDLQIKDTNRDSFLGGHSTLAVGSEDSFESILKRQTKMHIAATTKKIFKLLDEKNLQQASLLLAEIEDLDKGNSDVMAARGRHAFFLNRFDDSVTELRKAVASECSFLDTSKKHLSEALFAKGMDPFHRRDYVTAKSFFIESLSYDPSNCNSELHKKLCEDKLTVPWTMNSKASFVKYRK